MYSFWILVIAMICITIITCIGLIMGDKNEKNKKIDRLMF